MEKLKPLFWLLVVFTATALFVIMWLEKSVDNVPSVSQKYNLEDTEEMKSPQAETKYRALPISVKIPGNYCEHPHTEWERLGEDMFFKRAATFAFIESGYVILLLAAAPSLKLKFSQHISAPTGNVWFMPKLAPFDLVFDAHLSVGGVELARKNLDNFKVGAVSGNSPGQNPHLSAYVSINIEPVRAYLETPDVVFELRVSTKRGARILRPLLVHVKRVHVPGKRYAALGRCIDFGMDDTEVPLMEAWLLMQRRIGYNRVVLYNNSMLGAEVHAMFARYSDFVEIRQFECYPRFDSERGEFFSRTNNPWVNAGDIMMTKFTLDLISFMELYLSLVDQFEYVAIFDLDELILPRRIKQLHPYSDFAQPINIDPNRGECIIISHPIRKYILFFSDLT